MNDLFKSFNIDKNSTVPMHSQIVDFIKNLIDSGELKAGDALPAEIELSKEFGISRPTIRQALNTLAGEGYIYRFKGKGTYVNKSKVVQSYTQIIESYVSDMKNKGLIARTEVLELEAMIPDKMISGHLMLAKGEKVIKLKRLRYALAPEEENESLDNFNPLLLTTVYIPYKLLPTMLSYDFEVFSFYEVLEKNNLTVKKVLREMEAKNSNKEWSELLQIGIGNAVHVITSVGYLEDGTPIEFSESIYPGNKNKFIVEIVR